MLLGHRGDNLFALAGIIPKDSLLLPSARKPVTGEDDESSTKAADPFSGSTRTDSAPGNSDHVLTLSNY